METETTEAGAVDMQELMTAAAEGEVEEKVAIETEPETEVQAVEEEKLEPPDEDELPKDNAERSKLGRKLSALFRQMDERKEIDSKLAEVLEVMAQKELAKAEAAAEDDGELLTAAQAKKIMDDRFEQLLNEREKKKETSKTQYEKGYYNALIELSQDYEPGEFDAINEIMMKDFNIKHSDNAQFDAIRNFKDAEIKFLKSNKKTVPKGSLPEGAKIATTGGEKVTPKKDAPIKLDKAAQRYLDSVKRSRGPEAAKKLLEGFTKDK